MLDRIAVATGRAWVSVALVAWAGTELPAQQSPRPPARAVEVVEENGPVVTGYTVANSGLPSNIVPTVVVDASGAAWIGTQRGVARFDGRAWQVWTRRDGLPSDVVQALAIDSAGTVWAGTDAGIAAFDGARWRDRSRGGDPFASTSVVNVVVTADGTVWATDYASTLAQFRNGRWSRVSRPDGQETSRWVIAAGDDGRLWAATERGLAQRAGDRWNVVPYPEGVGTPSAAGLVVSERSGTWVAAIDGALRYSDTRWDVSRTSSSVRGGTDTVPPMLSAAAGPDGAVWFGTANGLARFAEGRWTFWGASTIGTASQVGASAVAVARDGVVWYGTSHGVVRIARSDWRTWRFRPNRMGWYDSFRVAAAPQGPVWAGGLDVLARFDGGRWRTWGPGSAPPYNVYHNPAVDAAGRAWLASDAGMTRFDGLRAEAWGVRDMSLPAPLLSTKYEALSISGTERTTAVGPAGTVWTLADGAVASMDTAGTWRRWVLPADDANSLAADGANTLWVGTDAGLLRLRNGEWLNVSRSPESGSNATGGPAHVDAVALGTDGAVWAGASQLGLARYAGGRWRYWKTADSEIPSNSVQALAVAPSGELWVGSTEGLARLDGEAWQVWTHENSGLPSNEIGSLAVGADGAVWIGTPEGVTRFRPPTSRPVVVGLVGTTKRVTQGVFTVGVRAYDPSYVTRSEELRYEWTVRAPRPGGKAAVDSSRTNTPFETFRFEHDGAGTIGVTAIDRYGVRSAPRTFAFDVAVEPHAATTLARKVLAGAVSTGVVYMLLLIPLVALYPHSEWSRTAVNSGVFTKFPLIHRTMLSSGWARARIFSRYVRRAADGAKVPTPFIPQSLAPEHPDDDPDAGTRAPYAPGMLLEGPARHVLVLGRSGTGKSVLLNQLLLAQARRFQDAGAAIPVLVNFRLVPAGARTLEELIRDELAGGGVELPEDVLTFLVRKGGFVILVDSINEANDDAVRATLQPFLARDAYNRVVIAGQTNPLKDAVTRRLLLDTVTPDQARAYLRSAVGHDHWDALAPEIQALTARPADLKLVAEILATVDPTNVPTRRADLYRELLREDSALRDWVEVGAPELQVVYAVAYRMLRERRHALRADTLGDWVRREWQRVGTGDDRAAGIVERTRRSRMFREGPGRGLLRRELLVSFSHELTGKYLAGRYVAQQASLSDPERAGDLLAVARLPAFVEVFDFAVDEIDSGTALSTLLLGLLADGGDNGLRIVARALRLYGPELDPDVLRKYSLASIDRQLETELTLA